MLGAFRVLSRPPPAALRKGADAGGVAQGAAPFAGLTAPGRDGRRTGGRRAGGGQARRHVRGTIASQPSAGGTGCLLATPIGARPCQIPSDSL